MFIPQSWITDVIGGAVPGWSTTPEELDAAFNRIGLETEGHQPLPETTGPLVIGRVEEIEELTGFKKPIRYCAVNVGHANGTGELQHIICGARNFHLGDTVVVALPGAVLPGNFAISARETYGRTSEGMMCSEAELGLTTSSEGIVVLADGVAELGADARPVVGLDDEVFEVNITPDRGYCLSARGLSREIASAFGLDYADPAHGVESLPAQGPAPVAVEVGPDTGCQVFGVRTVTDIDPTAVSPWWMRRRLLLAGQRPVNAATDVTNYVMLQLGLPMHAFDGDVVGDTIAVRAARAGERLTTLDHVERSLDPQDIVIASEAGAQSLAGVMGGSTSEISDETTTVHLEAAVWDPVRVFRTARRHKLGSEASRRYERRVDAALVPVALDLACRLLTDIAGGSIHPGRTIVGEVPARTPIVFADSRPAQVAGAQYPAGTTTARLEEVGCTVAAGAAAGELLVTPPTWRPDLTMGADLVEEVLRLEGLDSIPSLLPTAPAGRGLTPVQQRRRAIGHALAWGGYLEVLPTPFIADDTFDVWGLDAEDPRRSTVRVLNPLESDHSQLSTTLLPSMLEALRRNVSRGQVDLAIFGVEQVSISRGTGAAPMPSTASAPSAGEIADIDAALPRQPLHVATVATGLADLPSPWGPERAYGMADAIESARLVARAAGVELELRNTELLPWHPGRCAELLVDGQVVGHAGELHPQMLEAAGLPARSCAMELNIDALPLQEHLPAPVLSPYPAVHQDVAVTVSEATPAAAVQAALTAGAGELLEQIRLFDVYRSEQLGPEVKSLTFSLRFRAPDRTLTEDEASGAREAAVAAAAVAVGARVRA